MKKTFLSLIFIVLFSLLCFSQTNTDLYVVKPNGVVEINESKVMTIENQMTGTVVFPLSNLTDFYLINYDGKIISRLKNITVVSFDSEDLVSGYYYMILESQTNTEIYKLLK
jgi:hypothetical protein